MHVANVVQAAEEHHQAVDPQGDAAVRRGPELQGVQQEAEPLAGRLGVDAQQAEDLLLRLLDRGYGSCRRRPRSR